MPAICTIDNTDPALVADLAANGDTLSEWVVETFPEMKPDGFIDGNKAWQVIFSETAGRAGLVFVGSGSSGVTHWTDAVSCDHAYERLLNDDLRE